MLEQIQVLDSLIMSNTRNFHHEHDSLEASSPPPRTNTVDSTMSISSNFSSTLNGKSRPRHSESDCPRPSTAVRMQSQDSGYESYGTSPRASLSYSRPVTAKRATAGPSSSSTSLSIHNPSSRTCIRPGIKRSAKSYTSSMSSTVSPTPVYPFYPIRASKHQYTTSIRSPPQTSHSKSMSTTDLAHFPPSSESEGLSVVSLHHDPNSGQKMDTALPPVPPPQTTHYWTSDRTRRLEYAAIDAASCGVKGWLRRHLVPACIAPKAARHVAFDDDTGSVRRYRLDLEEDEGIQGYCNEKKALMPFARRKAWPFSA